VILLNKADVLKGNDENALLEGITATTFFEGLAVPTFRQVVVIDPKRGGLIALEFAVEAMYASGKASGSLSVSSPVRALPVSLSIQVDIFDNTFSLECVGGDGCQGPASGAKELVLKVKNMPISGTGAQVSDTLAVTFGSLAATSVQLLSEDLSVAMLSVVPPACTTCSFSQGSATIRLTIALRSDPTIVVSTNYHYWRAPRIVSAVLGPRATTVDVTLDQTVKRVGGEKNINAECPLLFGGPTLSSLGVQPKCTWTDSSSIQIELGRGTSIVPSSLLTFRAGVVATTNELAANEQTSVRVAAPEFPQPPTVELEGPSLVDMCSPLQLHATASSSRDVIYSWACYDNDVLDAQLQMENGSMISLPAGTPEMAIDTHYTCAVIVTDFLGTRSEPATIRVFKQGASAPILSFSPPKVSVLPSDEVSVSARLEFSTCSGGEGQMVFTWSQLEGPIIPERYLSVTSSQFYLPTGVLLGGRTYIVALSVSQKRDPAQVVTGTVTITVENSPLVAIISGGSHMEVSSRSSVSYVIHPEPPLCLLFQLQQC